MLLLLGLSALPAALATFGLLAPKAPCGCAPQPACTVPAPPCATAPSPLFFQAPPFTLDTGSRVSLPLPSAQASSSYVGSASPAYSVVGGYPNLGLQPQFDVPNTSAAAQVARQQMIQQVPPPQPQAPAAQQQVATTQMVQQQPQPQPLPAQQQMVQQQAPVAQQQAAQTQQVVQQQQQVPQSPIEHETAESSFAFVSAATPATADATVSVSVFDPPPQTVLKAPEEPQQPTERIGISLPRNYSEDNGLDDEEVEEGEEGYDSSTQQYPLLLDVGSAALKFKVVRRSPIKKPALVEIGEVVPPRFEHIQVFPESGNDLEMISTTTTTTTAKPNAKCNSDDLKMIILENIDTTTAVSKRKIQRAASELVGGRIDVICSHGTFSYIVNTEYYCETERNGITCFAFRQADS